MPGANVTFSIVVWASELCEISVTLNGRSLHDAVDSVRAHWFAVYDVVPQFGRGPTAITIMGPMISTSPLTLSLWISWTMDSSV